MVDAKYVCDILRAARRRGGSQSASITNILHLRKERKPAMPNNKSIDQIIAEAEQIERVWVANPTFTLGDVTLTKYQAMLASLRTRRDEQQAARAALTAATNAARDESDALHAVNTRARGGVRAFFGPNSTQYEQVGGKRSSDRKRPTRKNKPDGSGNSNSK